MTKEKFSTIISGADVDINDWFEYYKERGGKLDMSEFMSKFAQLLQITGSLVRVVNNKPVYLNKNTAFSRFYSHYQEKFKDEGQVTEPMGS
jgi:hypothetical protein